MSNAALDRLNRLAQAAKETGPDLTQAQTGGGDYTPPAEGATRLRFVGYVEKGIHTTQWNGNPKTKPRAIFTFELSGPKHPPREHEGKVYPQLIKFTEVVGRHEKNGYMKLFKKMAAEYPNVTNFIELLGKSFLGTVVHSKSKDGKKTFANLRNGDGYTIKGTSYEHPETNELHNVEVAPAITPIQVFLWDFSDLTDWDALFIDGTYDDGGSKNRIQEDIKAAENWVGSPVFNLLVEAGREEETHPAPKRGKSEDEDEGGEDGDSTPPPKAQPKTELAKDEADPLGDMA